MLRFYVLNFRELLKFLVADELLAKKNFSGRLVGIACQGHFDLGDSN